LAAFFAAFFSFFACFSSASSIRTSCSMFQKVFFKKIAVSKENAEKINFLKES